MKPIQHNIPTGPRPAKGKTQKLTQHWVSTAARPEPGKAQVFYWDSALTGFGLCISAFGRRSFVVQKRIAKTARVRRVVLGTWPAMTVEQARNAARPLLADWAAGRDQPRPTACITLGELIPLYLDNARAHGMRSASRKQGDLQRYLPREWRTRTVDSFTTADLTKLHTDLSRRGHMTANAFLRTLRGLFNWARHNDHMPESALNPCRKITWFPEMARERFLTLEEYDRLLLALNSELPLWRDFFQLLLLAAQRSGEVKGMTWAELDLDAAVWTIPAARTKNKKLQRVPLTAQMLDILRARRALDPHGTFVFPSPTDHTRPLNALNVAWDRIRARAGIPADVRIHDLRKTMPSYHVAAGVGLPIIGKLLHHSNSATTQIYARMNLDPVRAVQQQLHDRLAARTNGTARAVGQNGAFYSFV
jgi:integrase